VDAPTDHFLACAVPSNWAKGTQREEKFHPDARRPARRLAAAPLVWPCSRDRAGIAAGAERSGRRARRGPGGSSVPVPVRESEQPDRIEGGLAGIAPGDYKLKWQVLSVDGHITRGEIPFHVSRP
jgi:hypothetical protein